MQVKNLVKTKQGTYQFDGELSEEEHEFVITVGLHTLMEQGALPFMEVNEEGEYHTACSFAPGSEDLQ